MAATIPTRDGRVAVPGGAVWYTVVGGFGNRTYEYLDGIIFLSETSSSVDGFIREIDVPINSLHVAVDFERLGPGPSGTYTNVAEARARLQNLHPPQ